MQIRWSKQAKKDLEEIETYISKDNPLAAIDTILFIIYKIEELLPCNPAMGRKGRIMETRELVIPNYPYIVLYRVKNKELEILRILHTSKQWPDVSD